MDPLVDFERECFFIAPLGEEESGVRTRSDLILQFIVRPAAEELGLSAVRGDELAARDRSHTASSTTYSVLERQSPTSPAGIPTSITSWRYDTWRSFRSR